MLRKIGLTLVIALGIVSTSALASVHPLAPNVSVEFEFKPNISEVLSNVFFWTIKASCTLNSDDEDNLVHVFMKRKSATVNDMVFKEGLSQDLIVHTGDQLVIAAAPGAQVELINLGSRTIRASCTTAS
jgi:hypothetical protein